MAGIENDLLFGSNADFSGATNPSVANGLQTDNQIWVGATTPNAGGTNIDVRTLTAGTGISLVRSAGALTINASSSPNTNIGFSDDMLYGFLGTINNTFTGIPIIGNFYLTASQTGAAVIPQGFADANHPGIVVIQTGTTSTGSASMSTWNSNTAVKGSQTLGGGALTLTFYFNLPQLSNGTDRFSVLFGLSDSNGNSSPASTGVWISYSDNVNSGKWTINTKAAGVATNTNSSVTVATGWQVLQIQVNAAATSVQFFAGTTLAGLASLGTITTNIPTAASTGIVTNIVKSVGTTNCLCYIDLITSSQTLTTPR